MNDLAPYMSDGSSNLAEGDTEFLSMFELAQTLCAWCGRLRKPDGSWENTAIERGNDATHGICPECLASEMCKGLDERGSV
jgi:hypothetical protein